MSPVRNHGASSQRGRSFDAEAPAVLAGLYRRRVALPGGVLGAFEQLRSDAYPWLLDSALRQPGRSRYSFAGSDPYLVLRAFGRRIGLESRRAILPDLEEGRQFGLADPIAAVRSLMPRGCHGVGDDGVDSPCEAPFVGGAVGYFGYELETGAAAPLHGRDDLQLPDLALLFVDRLLVFDHERGVAWVCGLGLGCGDSSRDVQDREERARLAADELAARLESPPSPRAPAPLREVGAGADAEGELAGDLPGRLLATPRPADLHTEVDESRYEKAVATIVDEIAAGNVYQGDLTQRMDVPFCGESWSLYRSLRALNPAPFAAYLSLPEVDILSSSPERFLRVSAEGAVESSPIKGTRPRGADGDRDDELAAELASSSKDRAENLMIVDLVRNDLGRVCQLGSIAVPQLFAVERYASVFQMVSRVTGRLAEGRDALDAVRAAFPPGSMTGAPKIAAMRLLDRLEPTRRSIYSGAIGYLDARGGADLAVVIRTLLVKSGRAYLHVGGGVVADSQPAGEYRESIDKARALWAALAEARPDGA